MFPQAWTPAARTFAAFPGQIARINFLDDTVEWRLSGGRPFAIIYRITVDPATWGSLELEKWSYLMVETVGKSACRVAEIAGESSNANGLAREAADLVLTGKARCIDFGERR